MLAYYPFRYNDFSKVVDIATAPLNEKSSVIGTIDEVSLKRPRRGLSIVEVSVKDKTGVMFASWFNQPWLARTFSTGMRVLLFGKVEFNFNFNRMSSPAYIILDADFDKNELQTEPVYHATSDISTAQIARTVRSALQYVPAPLDPLPASLRVRHGFMSKQAALRNIHFPQDDASRSEARRRLAFEEVLYAQLTRMRERMLAQRGTKAFSHAINGALVTAMPGVLGFTLTNDQSNAIAEILKDMSADKPMARLLLGDVGSGKTVVAAHALAAACDSGWQACCMAPTEILAKQYASSIGPMFDALGIRWATLTASTAADERKRILSDLVAGDLSVLFGTHALLRPDVDFKCLSLAVIDEQHRFGVDQRQALYAKGPGCDVLALTATPIPRSLALVVYGDMQTSYLRTRPNPAHVTTKVVPKSLINEAYDGIRAALAAGHQAYIVCPLITHAGATRRKYAGHAGHGDGSRGTFVKRHPRENGDSSQGVCSLREIPSQAGNGGKRAVRTVPMAHQTDSVRDDVADDSIYDLAAFDDADHITAAEDEVDFLRNKVFTDKNVGLLTGKLAPAEKQAIMRDFRAGDIDVLVSTTVIEVGIDVPNATVMVIEDADRFGLAQLHQLRGRIGRGAYDGQLFLVSNARDTEAKRRLRLMERVSDGFKLAEQDLRLRHEGDVMGTRQHGAGALKLVNVIDDAKIIASAHEEAEAILDADADLKAPEHALLRHEIDTIYPPQPQ
jgi:ATP-dependent DNA helicase RecG